MKKIAIICSAAMCLSLGSIISAGCCNAQTADGEFQSITAAELTSHDIVSMKMATYNDDLCGKSAHWKLENGTLTIYGSGNMTDWENVTYTPWYSKMGEIRTVIISEGVTSVGRACFINASNLTSVTLPSTCTSINMSAFQGTGISVIDIPAACTVIGDRAFLNCSNLREIIIRNANSKIVTKGTFGNLNGTIIAPGGGTVEKFAQSGGYSFQPLNDGTYTGTTTAVTTAETTTTTVVSAVPVPANDNAGKVGDVNGDGMINLKDVVMLRRFIAGGWGIEVDPRTADVNSDGTINLKDAVMLRRYIAGGWNVKI